LGIDRNNCKGASKDMKHDSFIKYLTDISV